MTGHGPSHAAVGAPRLRTGTVFSNCRLHYNVFTNPTFIFFSSSNNRTVRTKDEHLKDSPHALHSSRSPVCPSTGGVAGGRLISCGGHAGRQAENKLCGGGHVWVASPTSLSPPTCLLQLSHYQPACRYVPPVAQLTVICSAQCQLTRSLVSSLSGGYRGVEYSLGEADYQDEGMDDDEGEG